MSKKAQFNKEQAFKLWRNGWCYEALSEQIGYAGRTIKKHLQKKYNDDKYFEACNSHREKHLAFCPLHSNLQARRNYEKKRNQNKDK